MGFRLDAILYSGFLQSETPTFFFHVRE